MPTTSGTAGMNAEPSCRRHASGPTWYRVRFAQKPLRGGRVRRGARGAERGRVQEYAKGGPHLPAHDEAAADARGAVFGGVDGDGGGLGAHADAEEEAAHEELLPGLGEAGADDGDEAEDGGEEDGAAAAEVEVEGVREPAAAAGGVSVR